jgi:hypothetical protein
MRQAALEKEKDPYAALKRYCDFMTQTERLRMMIDEAVMSLDAHIQMQIDIARGK